MGAFGGEIDTPNLDALAKRGDGAGARLLRALASLLAFERAGEAQLEGLGEAERECWTAALARCAQRGWAPPPGARDPSAPLPDPEPAVKDGFTYALLVWCSRIEAQAAALKQTA